MKLTRFFFAFFLIFP
ncbi:pheA operon leader peptide PheL [Salmonella enterica]|nr:pheA operon leader peptide PheL [Salmonella enterica]